MTHFCSWCRAPLTQLIPGSWCRLFCESLPSYCYNAHLSFLLLALSGDIESNPGANLDPTASLDTISATISRIELTQDTILAEVSTIRSTQTNTENLVSGLSNRVDALEKFVETHQTQEHKSSSDNNFTIGKLSSEIRALTKKCDDSANRLRRSNLIFLVFPMLRVKLRQILSHALSHFVLRSSV